MIKEGKFGAAETISLVVIAMSSKGLFSTTSRLISFAATSAWLTTLISCASASILFIFVYLLLKRFPGKNIIEIYYLTFGRVIGFVFSLTFAVAIMFCCGILIREFTAICNEYVFPNTPMPLIAFSLLIPVVVGSYLGIESIARFAKLTAYFTLTAFLLFMLMVVPKFEFGNMFPLMGYGLGTTVWEGLQRTCTYSEVIFIAIIAGSMQGHKQIKKVAYTSLVISGLIICACLLSSVLVLSYPVAEEQIAPVYLVSRQIDLSEFFKRLDPLFLYLWFSTTIITVAAEFYFGLSVYCKTFRLQDRRPLIFPEAVVVYAVSVIPKNFVEVAEALLFIRTYGIFVVFLMPVLALAVSLLRKKGAAS